MAIRISEVKSSRLSDDKKEVIVGGSGKYIGDVELKIARECVDDFIDALVSARGTLGSTLAVAAPSVDSAAGPKRNARSGGNSNGVRFEIPKTFAVTADTEGRGLVLLILNHRLENQEGYALSPDAAKQVAGGLTKSADAVLADRDNQEGRSQQRL
ncbi:hypothetical protein LJR220_001671 [Bradyrhizobium sp. LjRoot220]|uniref:hypothetical protein n=1 Tax=Bradyrhizobium sp. LjRoot220 TaxID=3342284 RepID=UPI003ECD40C6